jgi:hypothetical protein
VPPLWRVNRTAVVSECSKHMDSKFCEDLKRNPVVVSTGGDISLLWAHVIISCGRPPAPPRGRVVAVGFAPGSPGFDVTFVVSRPVV